MSGRLPAATFSEALAWWQLHGTWWGGATPVRCSSWPRGKTWWFRGPRADLAADIRWLDERKDEEILIGVPQDRPGVGGVGRASLLWCRVEGPDQLRRANAFRPRPSIVFAEGSSSRRLLWWPLERPASYFEVKAANRKLAYHLRAVQRHGDPDELWFCAPGTCRREGRARPVPVRVARLTVDSFLLDHVVGRLREPPDVQWWEAAR